MSEESGTAEVVEATTEAPVEATAVESTATAVEATQEAQSPESVFEAFKASLSDDLKGHSYLSKYKTAEDFAKAGINHQSALTKKASEYFESEVPEVVAERNKLMGVPESPDQYEINRELATGETLGEEGEKMFRDWAIDNGLPSRLAQPAIEFHAEIVKKINEQNQAASAAQAEATTQELQAEWKGDTFDHNIKQVQNLMSELGIDSEEMNKPIGNSPKLIKALFDKVVPLYGEDKLIEGTMGQTQASIAEQIDQINTSMFTTPAGTPEYKKLIAEKTNLMSKVK